jgi:hypothetical protein
LFMPETFLDGGEERVQNEKPSLRYIPVIASSSVYSRSLLDITPSLV